MLGTEAEKNSMVNALAIVTAAVAALVVAAMSAGKVALLLAEGSEDLARIQIGGAQDLWQPHA